MAPDVCAQTLGRMTRDALARVGMQLDSVGGALEAMQRNVQELQTRVWQLESGTSATCARRPSSCHHTTLGLLQPQVDDVHGLLPHVSSRHTGADAGELRLAKSATDSASRKDFIAFADAQTISGQQSCLEEARPLVSEMIDAAPQPLEADLLELRGCLERLESVAAIAPPRTISAASSRSAAVDTPAARERAEVKSLPADSLAPVPSRGSVRRAAFSDQVLLHPDTAATGASRDRFPAHRCCSAAVAADDNRLEDTRIPRTSTIR
eukprot:TRINITY_DN11325_c0_g1_i2.p1 TRINITY_DN11325_c0_g1~~TRINITY_DN11325_c0_g1_i2.p1  ORF type:complete len:295 (-),score=49.24 TRINITY_DN11325_c0_g1_i2:77-874(-)